MVFDIIAQQDPQYSQYMFNHVAVNPGAAGSSEAICLSAIHRQQWIGIEGAPVTSVFTANAPFKMFGADHGIGLLLMSDIIGFHQDVSVGLDYAFRFQPGSAPGKIGIGISGIVLNKALAATWNIPGGNPDLDPYIPNPNQSIIGFDFGIGVFYRTENVYLGLSSTHLFEPNLSYDKPDASHLLRRHYYATSGCTLPLKNPIWEIAPSLLVYSDGTTSQITANANFIYNKKVWGGMGYRMNEAMILMIGVELFNGMNVGYSFDHSFNNLRRAGASHEVMVGYCFNLVKERVVKKYKSVRYL